MPQISTQFSRGKERLIKIVSPQQRLELQKTGIITGMQGIEKIGGSEYFKIPTPQVLQTLAKAGFIDPRAPLGTFTDGKLPITPQSPVLGQPNAPQGIPEGKGQVGAPGNFLIG